MALQERLAFLMGFVKKEGEKEVGSWTSLMSSNLVSVIKVAKIVESAKKGVQLQKGSAEKLGVIRGRLAEQRFHLLFRKHFSCNIRDAFLFHVRPVCSACDVGSLFKRRDRTSDGLIVVRAIF